MFISGVVQSDSVTCIQVSILFQILFPFRLLQNIGQSSLCSTVDLCWLPILYVCTSVPVSQPVPPPRPFLPAAAAAKLLQSCPTPSDPMDCSPPGSPVHGIFQARVLEWGATAFSNCKHRAVMESTTSRLSSHTLLSRRPQTSQPMSSVCHVQKGVSTWSSPPRPTRKSMYRCEGWTIKGG